MAVPRAAGDPDCAPGERCGVPYLCMAGAVGTFVGGAAGTGGGVGLGGMEGFGVFIFWTRGRGGGVRQFEAVAGLEREERVEGIEPALGHRGEGCECVIQVNMRVTFFWQETPEIKVGPDRKAGK